MPTAEGTGGLGELRTLLATAFLAVIGWGVTHMVNRITSAPLVEYEITVRPIRSSPAAARSTSAPRRQVFEAEVFLHNLSARETFFNTHLILRSGESARSRMTFFPLTAGPRLRPEVVPEEPVWTGSTEGEEPMIEVFDGEISYRLPQLPPGGRVALLARFTGQGIPVLEAKLDSQKQQTLKFVKPSLETFIVRHEIRLILLTLGVAIALLLVSLFRGKSARRLAALSCAAIAVSLWTSSSYGQSSSPDLEVDSIQVVDIDTGQGIPSEILVLPPEGPSRFLTYVDAAGKPNPRASCQPNQRLSAKLRPTYTTVDSRKQLCARKVTISLMRTSSPRAHAAVLMEDSRFNVAQAGDYANHRWSDLDQINAGNVGQLQVAWTMSTGVLRGHEGAPLVVGDTMYVHTPFPNNVYAVNLKDQTYKWKYEPKQDASVVPVMCCDTVSRGLAYSKGRVFVQQADTTLVALDANTGKVVWAVKNGDPKIGETNTNAPHVFADKVITGISGGEFGVRGRLIAYNVDDGKRAWTAWSVGPDADLLFDPQKTMTWTNGKMAPVGKDSSLKSWRGEQWKIGGGTTWGWYSYDPKLNLVYYGSGNPGTWNPSQRPGDNKWSMTIFARDLDTGVAKWVYQMTPHDEWDFDGVNEVPLVDIDIKGKKVPALVHFDRNGFAYTLNRETGELLLAQKYDPKVNWSTGVDMKTGRPVVNKAYSPATTGPDVNVKDICPAALGTKDQQPVSFDRKSKLFMVPTNHVCMTYEPFNVEYTAGQPYVGATLTMFPAPNSHGGMGNFIAWDASAGKIVWSKPERFSVWSGALTTAGDVVFYGTLEGYVKAVSPKDGRELWKFKTPSGVIGNVFTYQFEDKQYVGVYSGIGGWAGIGMAAGLTESTAGLGAVGGFKDIAKYTTLGGSLFVFALPDTSPPEQQQDTLR